MKERIIKIVILLGFISIGIITGVGLGWKSEVPIKKELTIKARQYAYDPPVINANIGDTLIIKLVSLDVIHGFFVEGYDIDAKVQANRKNFWKKTPSKDTTWTETDQLEIIVNKSGKFRYRCSNTCGSMHPFMQGELIVHPNTPFHAGIGATIGFVIGLLVWFGRQAFKIKGTN
jgi:cytochrome c oxidase subunit 2